MRCQVCGRKIEKGQNFCPACGEKVKVDYERNDASDKNQSEQVSNKSSDVKQKGLKIFKSGIQPVATLLLLVCSIMFIFGDTINPRYWQKTEGVGAQIENIDSAAQLMNDIAIVADMESLIDELGKKLGNATGKTSKQAVFANDIKKNLKYTNATLKMSGCTDYHIKGDERYDMTMFCDANESWYIISENELLIDSAGTVDMAMNIDGTSTYASLNMDASIYISLEDNALLMNFRRLDSNTIISSEMQKALDSMVGKWIDISSSDESDYFLDMFSSLTQKNVFFLSLVSDYLTDYTDEGFTASKNVYTMKDTYFEKFVKDVISNNMGLSGFSSSELNDLNGKISIDLSDEHSPKIKYNADSSYKYNYRGSILGSEEDNKNQTEHYLNYIGWDQISLEIENIGNTSVELNIEDVYTFDEILSLF